MIRLDTSLCGPELNTAAEELLPRAAAALEALRSGQCPDAGLTGWFDGPRKQGLQLAGEIDAFVADFEVAFDTLVVIGVGGSYLGCRAVTEALSHPYAAMLARSSRSSRKPLVLYAGTNLSESALVELLDALGDRHPLLVVVSKSGTTTEPAVAFRVLRNFMQQRFGLIEAARRIIAVTDEHKGALRYLAAEAGYKSFTVPSDVGGRYSVLTTVGLVPLALAGFSIEALLRGADEVFRDLGAASETARAVLSYSATRHAAFAAGKRVELLAYSEPRLHYLAEWWKQLFGESEGKRGLGLFPAALSYTADLHSLGQYLQEGGRHLVQTFLTIGKAVAAMEQGAAPIERRLRVPAVGLEAGDDGLGYLEGRFVAELNEAAVQGTKLAHSDGGVPSMEVRLPELNERGLGGLFAFFETAAAVSALLLGVNPFDQPGVEVYKRNMFALLGKPGFEALGVELRRRL